MIDEIVCYVEEPPQISCEIQEVKIEWQNEYFPYTGEYTVDALSVKEDYVFKTDQCYLDQNITVVGHGLDQYSGPYEIQPTKEAQTIPVKGTYDTYRDITVLPGAYDPWQETYSYTSSTVKDTTIPCKDYAMLDDIKIARNDIDYVVTDEEDLVYTVYIK